VKRVSALLLWFATADAARAHAMLERASPPVGSVGNPAPVELRLRFSEPIELAFSRVTVTGPSGAVELGATRTAAGGCVLIVRPAHPLGPGLYRVTWRAVSSDTHVTQGDYRFRVGPVR
jgi:hypothetical protein